MMITKAQLQEQLMEALLNGQEYKIVDYLATKSTILYDFRLTGRRATKVQYKSTAKTVSRDLIADYLEKIIQESI